MLNNRSSIRSPTFRVKGSIRSCFMKQNNSFHILAPSFNNLLFRVDSIACFTKRPYLWSIQKWYPYSFLFLPLIDFSPHSIGHILTNRTFLYFSFCFSFPFIENTTPPKTKANKEMMQLK